MRSRALAVLAGIVALSVPGWRTSAWGVVPQSAAAQVGLNRAWTTQVGSPRQTGPIVALHFENGNVLVQTELGSLSALDANTGRVRWSTQVTERRRLCSEPATNGHQVAVVCGSMIHVLDLATGALQWEKQLAGTPGAGPTIDDHHVFVPMVNGMIEAFRLDKGAKQWGWHYKSAGRVLIPPMATEHTVSWTTEKGYLYVADPEALAIRYRLETRGAIHAKPAYWTPFLYACSTDGCVYAVNEASGTIAWKFMISDAIHEMPVAIENKVFVTSELAGLHCLDSNTASLQWRAPGIKKFVAASPTRAYGTDAGGRLIVMDTKSGARVGSLSLSGTAITLVNGRSDRIFLCDKSNVVQCLHEVELATALAYDPPLTPAAESKARTLGAAKKETKAASSGEATVDEPAQRELDNEPAERTDEDDATNAFDDKDEPAKPTDDSDDPFD